MDDGAYQIASKAYPGEPQMVPFTVRCLHIFRATTPTDNETTTDSEHAVNVPWYAPVCLVNLFGCALSIALLVFNVFFGDWWAFAATILLSFFSTAVGLAYRWHLPDAGPEKLRAMPGDIVIRWPNRSFLVVRCDASIARQLLHTPSSADLKIWQAVVGIVALWVTSLVVLAYARIESHFALAGAFIFLNLGHWAAAAFPEGINLELPGYDIQEEYISSGQNSRNFTEAIWKTILLTKSARWIIRSYGVPQTDIWDKWLTEAEDVAKRCGVSTLVEAEAKDPSAAARRINTWDARDPNAVTHEEPSDWKPDEAWNRIDGYSRTVPEEGPLSDLSPAVNAAVTTAKAPKKLDPMARDSQAARDGFRQVGSRSKLSQAAQHLVRNISMTYEQGLRLLRPRVKREFERLEWYCSCGQPMYGDYVAETDTALRDFAYALGSGGSEVVGTRTTPRFDQSSGGQSRSNAAASGASEVVGGSSNKASGGATVTSGEALPSKVSSKGSGDDDDGDDDSIDPKDRSTGRSIGLQMSAAKITTSAYFELCVTRGSHSVSLGEIKLVDNNGIKLVQNDRELFRKIRKRYLQLARRGVYKLLYRPRDIHFVRFGVEQGGAQTGIYEHPLAIPPPAEIKGKRYHYYECPLDPLPPIDRRTFFHLLWAPAAHPPSASTRSGSHLVFFNRLPKKLGDSILLQQDPDQLNLGWGVHIIKGPNKPAIAWSLTAFVVLSFVVSVVYDVVTRNKDSGFAIGQWLLGVLAAALTAIYFHFEAIA
ncbi:hypothetical protein LTR85_007836 [Meristemomyces frigidus]|nr:hypothetical protein LTR85_007836 [Meristemomyces frigidus]